MTMLDGVMGKICFHAVASSSLNHPSVSIGAVRICAINSSRMATALFLCQIAQPTVGGRGGKMGGGGRPWLRLDGCTWIENLVLTLGFELGRFSALVPLALEICFPRFKIIVLILLFPCSDFWEV